MENFTDHRTNRIAFWAMACIVLYGIVCAMGVLSPLLSHETQTLIVFLTFVPWLVYLFCHFFFLLRIWEEIPREFARTTPEMAAGLALVPFFHLYWQFVAFLGLYQDMNKSMQAYGVETRFDTAFVRFVCIAWVILFVLLHVFVVVAIAMVMPSAMASVMAGEESSQFEPPIVLTVFGLLINLVNTALTIAIYWITYKKVSEFIDIKSNVGQ